MPEKSRTLFSLAGASRREAISGQRHSVDDALTGHRIWPAYLKQNNSSARSRHMKNNLQLIAVPVAIATSFLVGCGAPRITARTNPGRPSIVQVQEGYDTVGRRWEDDNPPAKMISRNDVSIQNFTGMITDIDYANRELTLKDSQGRLQTFLVDPDVQRFAEAKLGDNISVSYYSAFNAEVRKPTAEEKENPLMILQSTGRSSGNGAPEGSNMRQIRAVVTIEGLDRAEQTMTVQGPRGKYYSARVADPSRFDDVRIGDTIVLTFTEAEAVSLTPAGK